MNAIYWLLIAFLILNVLDGLTTWLGLYRLPAELRASEANAVYKDVEKSFWPAMWKKSFFVIFGLFGLLYLASISHVNIYHALYVLNGVLGIAVLNNTGIYLSRVLTRRKVVSPVGRVSTLLQTCGLSQRLSERLAFYLLFGLITCLTYIIVGVFL